jgi:Trk K+ transport system NAD-binding subunit
VIAVKPFDQPDDTRPGDSDDFYEKQRRYHFTPRGDVELKSGDILVVIGAQDQLDKVRGNPT